MDAFARDHGVPIAWAEAGVKKEDHVRPYYERFARRRRVGVYFIFRSMEQGPKFHVLPPKAADPMLPADQADPRAVHAFLFLFGLTPETYSLTQLRYDVRKMKAHALVERDGRRYWYRLTGKGIRVATMFVLFHKRVCGPLANTVFQGRPDTLSALPVPIETAYYQADAAIQKLVDLLAA